MVPLLILLIFVIFICIFKNKKKLRGGQLLAQNIRLMPDRDTGSFFDSFLYWIIFLVVIFFSIWGIVLAFK